MSWLLHRHLIFLGLSLLRFEGCEGFFLRHTPSGKCISAEDLFWESNSGTRYWAEMVDDCLSKNASFRYLQSELLQNIATEGNLLASNIPRYQNRLFVFGGKSHRGKIFMNNPTHRLKQTNAGSLYFYDSGTNSCAQPDARRKYIDQKENGCRGTAEQRFTFGSVTEYGTKMKDVHCSPIQHMMVTNVRYGDFIANGKFDADASSDVECNAVASCMVKSLCGGIKNKSCDLTINNSLLPPSLCSGRTEEVFTEYTCVDNYYQAITTARNIRLWNSPNRGYLQIKDGSGWRYVREENWDKKRQKMLCQHMGFVETAKNIIWRRRIRLLEGLKIASGDLMCYRRRLRRTSCCAHLVLSTTMSSVPVPYVKCKMCNEPELLQNRTTFPDSVFSGSGSYALMSARFDRSGWCTEISRPKYLLIDLQKEYHITRVVTMGNRDQTKWIGQYIMAYSFDNSFRHARQMTGNTNGFQASITSLNIYNVRHIKIQSNTKTDFCLRIELCGKVQMPAPVKDVRIKVKKNSAKVCLDIERSASASSYIIKLNVYLNGEKHQTVTRRQSFGNFSITGLTPNTVYYVGIETEDGSSQKSSRVFMFKTKTGKANNEDDKQINETSYKKNVTTYITADKTTGETCKSIAKSHQMPGDVVYDNRPIHGTRSYLSGVTFVAGGIFGILLSYVVWRFRRYRKRRKHQASSEVPGASTDKAGQNATYDSLDLTKMNFEDNYQSLRKSLSGKEEETCEHAEPYTQLNKIREIEEHYQALK
ncbi:uncharacterized protein LOC114541738 [Dendronephthya gigantea]|uniref:uncharacterized protein LOC114541738 n=1 Tax=Dendronephthya gigantea TaxID=151771 RepID=UPI00106977E1|nr:uncharacterized protein LOC114541738 [Dendronephthya gigantea]